MTDAEQADFIVVGSGSAGAVVAARLSEETRDTVLVLEAGPANRGAWSRIPLGFGKILADPGNLWRRESAPEAALGGRAIGLMHGRVAGGSSAVNGMVYVRGFPLDYALWRQMGAAGWSYDEVLPFFRRAERFAGGADAYHGGDGPVGVEGPGWRNPLADAFLDAAGTLGLPRNDDLAGPEAEGVGYHHLTTWRGRRSSTWHAYLAPARGRRNLRIATGAFVRRVLVENGRAVGVEYERGGERRVALARREVVLSAGALRTPQLLQLSGIGPGALLQRLGIPVARELPGVGENLMDHLQASRGFRTASADTINALMRSRRAAARAGLDYALRRRGPLTIGAALAGGFARTRPGLDAPDVQVGFTPALPTPDLSGLAEGSGFLLSTYQLRPESRGHVRIASPDPHAPSEIAMNALSTANDRATLLAGLRLLGRIGRAAPLRALGAEEVSSGPGRGDGAEDGAEGAESDTRLLAHVARVGGSAYHYCGTARIGADDRAVVDPALAVRGVDGLAVVDASVMPTVTSGNTNAAAIMIGERGASLIRARHR